MLLNDAHQAAALSVVGRPKCGQPGQAVYPALPGAVRHPRWVNFGDVPTWVAAIGTVGALIAAFIQISTERKYRHAQEDKDRAERHIAQARLVAAFLGSEETRGRPTPEDLHRKTYTGKSVSRMVAHRFIWLMVRGSRCMSQL